MDIIFEGVDGNFKIGRKISENVGLFPDIESEHFDLHSPELFRIVIKWIGSMEDVLVDTQHALAKMKYFRVAEIEEEQFSYFPLYTSKQEVIFVLAGELEKSSKFYKSQVEEQ